MAPRAAAGLPDLREKIFVPNLIEDQSALVQDLIALRFHACNCGVTALNVSPPSSEALFEGSTKKHLKPGREVLNDIKALGQREGVSVKRVVEVRREPEPAILNQIKKGKHNLLVVGANVRPGEGLFFGHSVSLLLQKAPCSLLVVSS